MLGFLSSVVVIAIILFIISKIPTGVEVDSPWIALIAGAIIGAFNGIWSLFPGWFRATNAILSLGLIPLIGSIIVFGLAAWLIEGFRLRWGCYKLATTIYASPFKSSISNKLTIEPAIGTARKIPSSPAILAPINKAKNVTTGLTLTKSTQLPPCHGGRTLTEFCMTRGEIKLSWIC